MTGAWESVTGDALQQGDWLSQCPLPLFGPEFGRQSTGTVDVARQDVLVS